MSVTVHFKDISTKKTTSLEYQMGAVIPELGDYIVSRSTPTGLRLYLR